MQKTDEPLELELFNYDLAKCTYHFVRDKEKYLLAEKLYTLRLHSQLTISEVAYGLGITAHTYAEYENGNTLPLCTMVLKMSQFYNVSLDYLRNDDLNVAKHIFYSSWPPYTVK